MPDKKPLPNGVKPKGLNVFNSGLRWKKKDYLKKALDDFRDNRESTTPIHRETLIKGHDTFQDELLKGEFPPIKHKCPTYTIDKPWDNLRYWNNPLPKGIFVFADSHKRVKEWRAVKLNGLGAFPVLWAIRYALEQRCWALARKEAPRTRKIDFAKFDVQTGNLTDGGECKAQGGFILSEFLFGISNASY